MNLDQETLQEYSRTQIGRRPQLFGTWKTTSIIWEMEDDLNSLKNGRQNQCFWKMEYNLISGTKLEDDLNFLANGRRPQFFGKWKTTSIFSKMEDNLNFKVNGRRPKF